LGSFRGVRGYLWDEKPLVLNQYRKRMKGQAQEHSKATELNSN
jgi:hypothetical protein